MNAVSGNITTPLQSGGIAVVFGASGGIGSALAALLRTDPRYADVVELSRSSVPGFDLTNEDSIVSSAAEVARSHGQIRLAIVATGALAQHGCIAEKSWRQMEPEVMARAFAINAIGPALLMKHFLPLMPQAGKSVFAALSARVGSIGDNHLGGWYGYRAAKAALNQIVRSAAIELKRSRPQAICVAIHPGTVATALTAGFAKKGLEVQTPDEAATKILSVIDGLSTENSGGFFDQHGKSIPW